MIYARVGVKTPSGWRRKWFIYDIPEQLESYMNRYYKGLEYTVTEHSEATAKIMVYAMDANYKSLGRSTKCAGR